MRAAAVAFLIVCGCTGTVGGVDADAGGAGGGTGGGQPPDGGGGGGGGGTGGGTGGGDADAGIPDAGFDAGMDAGVDGGAADSGLPDAGADAGPSCRSQFCDDFERYDAGRAPTAPWSTSLNGGTVTVDTAKAHGGTHAVKVTTDGLQAYRQAYFGMKGPFFPVTGNAFYGRLWVWLTAAPPMTTHWTNISGEGTAMNNGTPFAAYVRYGGQVAKQLMANYDSSVFQSDCWQHSTVAFPEGKWSCMEWHFDGPNTKMEFWLDGAQIPALTVNQTGMGCINNGLNGTWVMPVFDTLRLGWEHYQTSIPIELWIDDVALDTQRIGCQ